MNDTRNTPADPTPFAYELRAWAVILSVLIAGAGCTVAEVAQIIGANPRRLRAGLDNPAHLRLSDVFRLARWADVRPLTWAEQARDGARIIAAQVRDGHACRRCGRTFRVGIPSRADGFGKYGQLFACAPGHGCTLDDRLVDDDQAPRPGDRFAIRHELEDGSTGYEPVTVVSVGAYVLADGVEDTQFVGVVELEPIERADVPPTSDDQSAYDRVSEGWACARCGQTFADGRGAAPTGKVGPLGVWLYACTAGCGDGRTPAGAELLAAGVTGAQIIARAIEEGRAASEVLAEVLAARGQLDDGAAVDGAEQ
ncbi:hypothetical protein [Nocardia sp. AG03]|uniref:hypothetical protein n=1 Tax=Nocardia sp. AG03 TaxID=3025312 RepID=UPI0024183A67|nr:hypothetical protein [Nocardia sp. AG03]